MTDNHSSPSQPEDTLVLVPQTGDSSREVNVQGPRFTVGRAVGQDLQIDRPDVSSKHAAIVQDAVEGWLVDDLGSTNGTFVNGQRATEPTPLRPGDLLSFSSQTFKVEASAEDESNATVIMTDTSEIQSTLDLSEILEGNRVFSHFQPIFDARTRSVVAWEALGRGTARGEPIPPGKIFGAADRTSRSYLLSKMMRTAALECLRCGHCWKAPDGPEIWINLHPAEVTHESLEIDLGEVAETARELGFTVVIEVPETWVSHTEEMKKLVNRVRDTGLRVAYDDFGAGQSRLQDLMAVPPDYIKFDRCLVEGVNGDAVKRDLVEALAKASRTLGAKTLAEGIEEEEELAACIDLGIELVQGFLLERPKPAFRFAGQEHPDLPETCQHVRLGT